MRWIVILLLAVSGAAAADTVLYANEAVTVEKTLADPNDLWIDPAQLPQVNGFELKPEGACIDDICVPVMQNEDSNIFVTRGGESWFNVTELANRLQQPYVADHDTGVWSFGAIPAQRSAFTDRGIAPDFVLPDTTGRQVSLTDFQRKKILLLTWASW